MFDPRYIKDKFPNINFADLSPFDFFRQETSHQDPVVRTEAMNKVCLIIALMGPDKTRNDMLPYLISEEICFLISIFIFSTFCFFPRILQRKYPIWIKFYSLLLANLESFCLSLVGQIKRTL